MGNRSDLLVLLIVLVIATVFFSGCSDDGSSGTVTTVPTTESAAKFATGDIVAKTATSTDTLVLIVKYDSSADKYERALVYRKSDGTYYRKDSSTDLLARSSLERLYPAKVTHVSSLTQVPVSTPTTLTTATTATVTTTATTTYDAPIIGSITPNTGLAGTTVTITSIAGSNFRSGVTVRLSNVTTTTTISASSVVAESSTKITCYITIPSTAIAGAWNVTVTNPDGKKSTLANSFTITNVTTTTTTTTTTTVPPTLTVTSITPSSGIQGTTVSITNLVGTGFQTGSTVTLYKSGSTNITATGVMASSTQITCALPIPSDATVGSWNVVVKRPDGYSATLPNGFTINYPAPTITGINPSDSGNVTAVSITNLAGTGFRSGATVKLTRTGYSDITAMSPTVVSSTQITCSFDLTGAALGPWNVMVTNSDSQSTTYAGGFTVS